MRFRNEEWNLGERDSEGRVSWEQLRTAVLMDIRDELKTLNRLLGCPNFTEVPQILRDIRKQTKRPTARKTSKATKSEAAK